LQLNNSGKTSSPLIVHIFYFLIACTFCFLYFQKIVDNADFNAPNSINAVLSFATMKPYQFRLFIPFIFKILSVLSFIPPKAIYMLMNCFIVYLTVLTYYHFLNEYFQNKITNLFLAPIIIYPMLWNYVLLNQTFQYYDLCAVLFFVLGLYCIIKDNFKLLLIVFVLGIFNKETAVYLIFAYLLFNYKSVFKLKILINTIILAVIFITAKSLLVYIFRNNPGDAFEITFSVNIDIIKNIFRNRIYAKNISLSFGGLYIFAVLLFISGRWKKFPDLKMVFVNLAIVPYLLLGIFLIYFTEVRVYAELIPMFTTLFVIYLSTFEKLQLKPRVQEIEQG
jgi:hypothetical protein